MPSVTVTPGEVYSHLIADTDVHYDNLQHALDGTLYASTPGKTLPFRTKGIWTNFPPSLLLGIPDGSVLTGLTISGKVAGGAVGNSGVTVTPTVTFGSAEFTEHKSPADIVGSPSPTLTAFSVGGSTDRWASRLPYYPGELLRSMFYAGMYFDLSGTGTPDAEICDVNTFRYTLHYVTPDDLFTVSGDAQTVVGNATFGVMVAKLVDSDNNPLAGIPIMYTCPSSGASGKFKSSSLHAFGTTDVNGEYRTPELQANAIAGAWQLTCAVQVEGVSKSCVFNLTNVTPSLTASTLYILAGGLQAAKVSTAFPNPIIALVLDQYGNPLSGATVTFSGGGTNNCSFGGSVSNTAVSDSLGWATMAAPTAGTTVGSYNITISCPGCSNVQGTFTNAHATSPLQCTSIVQASGGTLYDQCAVVAGGNYGAWSFTCKRQDNSNVPNGTNVIMTSPVSEPHCTFSGSNTQTKTTSGGNSAAFSAATAAGTSGYFFVQVRCENHAIDLLFAIKPAGGTNVSGTLAAPTTCTSTESPTWTNPGNAINSSGARAPYEDTNGAAQKVSGALNCYGTPGSGFGTPSWATDMTIVNQVGYTFSWTRQSSSGGADYVGQSITVRLTKDLAGNSKDMSSDGIHSSDYNTSSNTTSESGTLTFSSKYPLLKLLKSGNCGLTFYGATSYFGVNTVKNAKIRVDVLQPDTGDVNAPIPPEV